MAWQHRFVAIHDWCSKDLTKFIFDLLERAAICAGLHVAAKRAERWEMWVLYLVAALALTAWMVNFVFSLLPTREAVERRMQGQHFAYGLVLTSSMTGAVLVCAAVQWLTYTAVMLLIN